MTTAEPWPADGPKLDGDAGPERAGGRLNQPWRAAVAGVELVAAVALVLLAWWAWGRGVVTIHLPGPHGTEDVVTRSLGSWLAGSAIAATTAGLLLIDATRQVGLATRAARD
ncbi:hypothetical protein EIL87_25795 [Saccharopolyspora rhizosphaerae]|uniref:Uncharacterized protein n=1 Tax=Saccharopolyspora rhizosphaerae TaxID=2492662 RepID=A0A426JIP7_9PSEU|nr:hypothetical protein [Saccharopolyspora rhizosphaerae]RRO13064.1 hypothetical protein EIL87_25795 [Saccharopolyspora rhizosphaerae]